MKENEIAVVMPSIDQEKAQKTMNQLIERAGIDATFMIVMDDKRQGFIKAVNNFVEKTDFKYYVYVAEDSYAGKDWLKIAYETLETTKKGLFAFNDGKWGGMMAAFGMVRKSWKGPFFNELYKSHYADVELSIKAMSEDQFVADLRSILVEVDYDKHGVNMEDKKNFNLRKIDNFSGTVDKKFVNIFS